MFKHIRIIVILITLSAIIFKFTTGIASMNQIKSEGDILLLKLRPVDPRALMMGDYMALAYDASSFLTLRDAGQIEIAPQGTLILKLDQNRVGTYSRLDTGTDPSDTEIRVKYALKSNNINFGSIRYYFQEGTAQAYQDAKYGMFKVSPSGHMILVALADENYVIIKADSTDLSKP